jgi:hypothetical protein
MNATGCRVYHHMRVPILSLFFAVGALVFSDIFGGRGAGFESRNRRPFFSPNYRPPIFLTPDDPPSLSPASLARRWPTLREVELRRQVAPWVVRPSPTPQLIEGTTLVLGAPQEAPPQEAPQDSRASEADLFLVPPCMPQSWRRYMGRDTQATAMARGARCSPLQEAQHALEQVWQE